MKKNNILAFTLVELIVVITIVGILSTVGFVSYSGYLTGARDSNRFSQLTKLSDSLQIYAASKSLPLPDDYIEITASGASNVIAYQGYVGVDVLETIDYTNGGKDPKDDSYFTYYLTKDRQSLQLMTLMEESGSVALQNNTTYAADYSERFPKVYGKKMGVLTEIDTNTPIQEVSAVNTAGFLDIVNTVTEFTAHISDDETIQGTGSLLLASNPNANCDRIKQTGQSRGNGIYTLTTLGDTREVYCDMETDGGGWTMIARSVEGGTGTFGWLIQTGDIQNLSAPFSFGGDVKSLGLSEMLITSYNDSFSIEHAMKIDINKNFIVNETAAGTLSNGCRVILGNPGAANVCARFRNWGFINATTSYHFDDTTFDNYGLRPGGYYISTSNFGNMLNQQGMLMVR